MDIGYEKYLLQRLFNIVLRVKNRYIKLIHSLIKISNLLQG